MLEENYQDRIIARRIMGVYEQLDKAMEDRNAKHYIDALHDDYEFIRHQSGTSMNKEQIS